MMARPLKAVIKSVVPAGWRGTARQVWADDKLKPMRRLIYLGWARYVANCKSYLSRFVRFRRGSDPLAVCPVCYSHGRHRMFWLWLPRGTDLLDGRPQRL